jgi:hypothetical protein
VALHPGLWYFSIRVSNKHTEDEANHSRNTNIHTEDEANHSRNTNQHTEDTIPALKGLTEDSQNKNERDNVCSNKLYTTA